MTLKCPISIAFIIIYHFFEKFCAIGVRIILPLYLVLQLKLSELEAKLVYHGVLVLGFVVPLIGAIVCDKWLGKYKTILYFSLFHLLGSGVIMLGSIHGLVTFQLGTILAGYILIIFGSSLIQPLLCPFGIDQLVLPEQNKQVQKFFHWFYCVINSGAMVAILVTPNLRHYVQCFEQMNCYPVAFAVPGFAMILGLTVLVCGEKQYRIKKPSGNVIIQVLLCICCALRKKCRKDRGLDADKEMKHWMDWASGKYDEELIKDIKVTLRVLYLFLPMPLFWTLYSQTYTSWVFMATRMNGDFGFTTILPEQVQMANPIMILMFIPLFDWVIYPLFGKCALLKKPLTRINVGGILIAVSYIISAMIQLKLETEYPAISKYGEGHLRIYNSLPCVVHFEGYNDTRNISSMKMYHQKIFFGGNRKRLQYTATINPPCSEISPHSLHFNFTLLEKQMQGHFIKLNKEKQIVIISFDDDSGKPNNGFPTVRFLIGTKDDLPQDITLLPYDEGQIQKTTSTDISSIAFRPGKYAIYVGSTKLGEVHLKNGGMYVILGSAIDLNNTRFDTILLKKPNVIHILWLLPQYVVLTVAEILFSITSLEFTYSQTPPSMKSLVQACYVITIAVGNLIIVVVEEITLFTGQGLTFLLYAGCMIMDVIVFMIMGWHYKYVHNIDITTDESASDVYPLSRNKSQFLLTESNRNLSKNTSKNLAGSAKYENQTSKNLEASSKDETREKS